MPSKPKQSPTLKKAISILKSKIEIPKTKKKSFIQFFKNSLKKIKPSQKPSKKPSKKSSKKTNKRKNKKGKKMKGGGVGMPIEYFGGLENVSQWDLAGGNTTWGSSEGLSRAGSML